MSKLLSVILLLISCEAYSQTPNWLWAKKAKGFEGSINEQGWAIACDAAGNTYSTGWFGSSFIVFEQDTLFNTESSATDIFLVKYDSNGNVIWARNPYGNDFEFPHSITVCATDNSVYIVGYFFGPFMIFGSDTLTNSGPNQQFYLAKYSASGTPIWARKCAGPGAAEAVGVTADVFGNVYIGGSFSDTYISFGLDTLFPANATWSDIFLAKYDSAGNVLWAKRAGGSLAEGITSLSIDAFGHIYAAGEFSSYTISFDSLVLTSPLGAVSLFLVKYDLDGNAIWARSAGGIDDNDHLSSIITNPAGDIYLAGSFGSSHIIFGNDTLNNDTSLSWSYHDMYLAKYDSGGNAVWAKRAGGNHTEGAIDIAVDDSSNCYVTGRFRSANFIADTDTLNPVSLWDIFLLKYTNSGNIVWAKSTGGGSTLDAGMGVCVDASYNIYINGYYDFPNVSFDYITLEGTGYSDFFIAKLDPRCFPPTVYATSTNPLCFGGMGSALITTQGGNPPFTYSWSNGDTTATASGLIAGIYTVTVSDGISCMATASISISQPAALLSSTELSNTTCGDTNGSAVVHVSGGTGGYAFSWSPSGGTDSIATGLAAGTYTVLITDSNGCSLSDSVNILGSSAPVVSAIFQQNVLCFGDSSGSANISVTGGIFPYSYNWFPNTGASSFVYNLWAGVYTVTVTDSAFCTTTASITITQPPVLTSGITASNTTCGNDNGSAVVNAQGGTGAYSFSWSPIGATDSAVFGLSPGIYTVIITDANGCTHSSSVNVAGSSAPVAVLQSQQDVLCYGDSTGSAAVGVTGGNLPYLFSWSPYGGTNATANNLSAGSYTVIVTDSNACTSTATVTITETTPFNIASTILNDSCSASTGEINVSVNGGTPGYTYLWNNGQTTLAVSGLAEGLYLLTVTDSNNCADVKQFVVENIPCLSVPNVFTPNNDGLNDLFYITNQEDAFLNLMIYNRWGELVRELDAAQQKWDGKDKAGKEVTQGVYYYVAVYMKPNNEKKVLNGFVELLR